MQYADINAARVIANHIAGKIFITAPLEFGQSLLDIDSDAFDYLVDHGHYVYPNAVAGSGHYSDVNGEKTLFVVPEPEIELGDVLFYDIRTQNLKILKQSDLPQVNGNSIVNNDYFLHESMYLIPIGVVVIPSSWDVYGDGTTLVASFRLLQRDYSAEQLWNPQNNVEKAQSGANPWYNQPDSSFGDDTRYTQIKTYGLSWATNWAANGGTNPLLDADRNSSSQIIGGAENWSNAVNLTSDSVDWDVKPWNGTSKYYPCVPGSINSASGTDVEYVGTGVRDFIPSPFRKIDGVSPVIITKNSHFFRTEPGLAGDINCLHFLDGYKFTRKMQRSESTEDWKTTVQQYPSDSRIHFYSAGRVWEFYTPGTNRGDWYIPSLGEMMFIANFDAREIVTTLDRICYAYGTNGVIGYSFGSYSSGTGGKHHLIGTPNTEFNGLYVTSSMGYNVSQSLLECRIYVDSEHGIVNNDIASGSSSVNIIPVMRIK